MSYSTKRFFVFALLAGCFYLPMAFAAPRLKLEPLAKQISVGQHATVRIQLEWPQSEGSYEINSLEPKLENLTLEAQNQSQESGTTVLHTLTYEFRALNRGLAFIYPFEINYRKSAAEPWIPIMIPEQKAKVVAGITVKTLLVCLGVFGVLSAALFTAFKMWRNQESRKAANDLPPEDPKQRFYAKAEESIATFTSSDSKDKLAYWSNQLRAVVAAYYDIPAKTATNSEVLSFLKSKEIPAGELQEIARLFEQLNELQFSRQDIPAYDLDRTQKTLLHYVKGKIIIGNSHC